MMNDERWQQLEEVFSDAENFDDAGYYTANDGYPPFDLMGWLESNSRAPKLRMVFEFRKHGYLVYAGEKDTFGWLTGIVEHAEYGRKMVFG